MRKALGIGLAVLAVLALMARGRDGPRESEGPAIAAARVDSSRVRARRFWELYRAATRYRTAGDPEAAAAAYGAALALDGAHEDALYYLGNVELERGRYGDAERAWRRLVEVNPRSDRGYARLGELYLCSPAGEWRDLSRAEVELQRALDLNREQTGPLLRLGQVALLRGRAGEATAYFAAVLGTDPGSGPAHYFAGYLTWKDGDAGAALRHYTRALSRPAAAPGSNEGDTNGPPAPSLLRDPSCPLFQAHLATVGDPGRPAMEKGYRRLENTLAESVRAP